MFHVEQRNKLLRSNKNHGASVRVVLSVYVTFLQKNFENTV